MNSKAFSIIIAVLVIGGGAAVALHKTPPAPRLGVDQADEGRKHVSAGQKQTYKAAIPTSGPHANEAKWGVSYDELPNESVIHNMEHGGVVISYRPDIDSETISKLQSLFSKPFAVASFTPSKAVLMPRAEQKKPIVLASWDHILELDSYNQQKIIDYYLGNIGKSPEPTAS